MDWSFAVIVLEYTGGGSVYIMIVSGLQIGTNLQVPLFVEVNGPSFCKPILHGLQIKHDYLVDDAFLSLFCHLCLCPSVKAHLRYDFALNRTSPSSRDLVLNIDGRDNPVRAHKKSASFNTFH